MHEPNDNCLFPGQLASQVTELEDQDNEWAIESIVLHHGTGTEASFQACWKSGDLTWVPYLSVKHLRALVEYLGAMGVASVESLPEGQTETEKEGNPQIFLGGIHLDLVIQARKYSYLSREIYPQFMSLLIIQYLSSAPPTYHY